jgi:GrpB-like predicted nucleotidyltransferase (UPF0157 family)
MIVEYNEAWPKHFAEVREYLESVLATDVTSIEHVGSTAVAGSVSKPIIDIHLAVPDAGAMARVIETLATLGYVHEGDGEVAGREAFRRKGPDVPFRDPKRDWFPHHLYASVEGEAGLERHVAFRDHLRSHGADRDAYAELKRSLLAEHGHDREAYELGKAEFTDAVLARAGYTG